MSKKNFVLIIAVNVFFLSILYCGFVHYIKKQSYYEYKFCISSVKPAKNSSVADFNNYDVEEKPKDFVYLEYSDALYDKLCGEERIVFGKQYNKNPIIIMGCSYAYGHGLEKNQTFPYYLSELTKRPVYNFSACGSDSLVSLNKFIDYLKKYKNEQQIINNADYVIYLYMGDHINRYLSIKQLMEYYHKIDGATKFDKLASKNFLLNYLNMKLKKKQILNEYPDSEKSSIYLKKLILYWHSQVKQYIPNAKTIIIVYNEKIETEQGKYKIKYVQDVVNSHIWQELNSDKNNEIEVLHTKDLMGFAFDKDWKNRADIAGWHPIEKVWKEFTPLFVEKYIKD